jgi:prevent-host-death family protein
MGEVPVRQLNQDTAGVLARVKQGEKLDVTERGTVIASLVPVASHPLADLVAAGTLHLPTRTGRLRRPTGPIRTDHEAGELIREMRDDERY